MANHAQVLRVIKIGTPVILYNRKIFPRTLFLYQLVFHRQGCAQAP